MNTEPTDSHYMLLFRGPDWDRGVSREEILRRMDRVMSWFEGLQQRGIVKAGNPLAHEGRIVSGAGGQAVCDGPFPESKEVIGGYLVIQAADLNEAVDVARKCPTLDFGIDIEVRPMLRECPISARLREQEALAAV